MSRVTVNIFLRMALGLFGVSNHLKNTDSMVYWSHIKFRRGLLTTTGCQQTFKPEKSGDNRLSPAKSLLTTSCIFTFLPIPTVFHFQQL